MSKPAHQQINLFNPALLKQKQVLTSATMLMALGLLLAGGAAITLVARQSVQALERDAVAVSARLEQAKRRQAAAVTEFAPRSKSTELQAQIDGAQAGLRALHEIDLILKGGQLGGTQGYAEYLRALARQSSAELWLTGVSISGAGGQVGLQGRALTADAVPAYIKRLTREPILQGKTFGSLQIDRPQLREGDAKPVDAPFIEFSLQAEGGKPQEERR